MEPNKNNHNRIRRNVLIAALSLLLAWQFQVGSSYAWFSSTVTSANTLTIGSYSVSHSVTSITGAENIAVAQLLPKGVTPAGMYNLKITARGDSAGFARIRIRSLDGSQATTTLFTPMLSPGQSVTYSLNLGCHAYVESAAVWSDVQTQTPLPANSSILYGVIIKAPSKDNKVEELEESTAQTDPAQTLKDKVETPVKVDTTELETAKTETKVDAAAKVETATKVDIATKVDTAKLETVKAETKVETKVEAKVENKVENKVEAKTEIKTETVAEPAAQTVTPPAEG